MQITTDGTTKPIATKQANSIPGRSVWLPLAWFGGLLGLSYAIPLARLAEQWFTNEDMGHGVFVPVLVGYIVWQRRAHLLATPAIPTWWALPLMILGGALLCVGPPSLPTFASVTRVGLLFSLTGTILFLGGRQILRALAYPLILLLLMIPVPGFLYERVTLPLQFIASTLSEAVLEGMGHSVLREGNVLHMPNQTLAVVEACSGLRSLLSLLFLGQAYIFLIDPRPWMRVWIAVLTIPIAIIANASRIIFSAIMGQYSRSWTSGFLHESTAWVVFVVAFACLVLAHVTAHQVAKSRYFRGRSVCLTS
jgi:exosortase